LFGDIRTTEISKQLAETLHPILENWIKRLNRKVLCRTYHGCLCLVSKYARQDDNVTLLTEGNLPMVLRKAPAFVYEPISSANVKNVMDGSLWAHLQTFDPPQQSTIV